MTRPVDRSQRNRPSVLRSIAATRAGPSTSWTTTRCSAWAVGGAIAGKQTMSSGRKMFMRGDLVRRGAMMGSATTCTRRAVGLSARAMADLTFCYAKRFGQCPARRRWRNSCGEKTTHGVMLRKSGDMLRPAGHSVGLRCRPRTKIASRRANSQDPPILVARPARLPGRALQKTRVVENTKGTANEHNHH